MHLGNGCSACAIKGGKSVDTSMGMTPLEGLMMGTRCGDIDPTVIDFLVHKEGSSFDEIFSTLNKRSGLLGISGLTNDMRELETEAEEHQDRRAILAIDMFCHRVKKYIGAYIAEMNGTDAICFAGGIGENSSTIRRKILGDMEWLGVKLDESRNEQAVRGKEMLISADDSRVPGLRHPDQRGADPRPRHRPGRQVAAVPVLGAGQLERDGLHVRRSGSPTPGPEFTPSDLS